MSTFYVSAPGESPPPVPEGPALCNTSEMRIIHDTFLFGYGRAAGLVRGVAAGDTDRSSYVGTWLGDLDKTLHVHHEGEDLLLWDKLEQRAPSCALHVGQMRAHHAKVREILDAAAPLLTEWSRTADPEVGERLAQHYEEMLEVLRLHLRREVVEIVPVAAKVLRQPEWDELGKHGFGAIPMSRLMPQMGVVIAVMSEEDRAGFMKHVPTPVKAMYRVFGRRQFEKQYRTLFPGEPVPRT